MNMKVGLKVGNVELNFDGAVELFEAKFEKKFDELLNFGRKASTSYEKPASPEDVRSPRGEVPSMTIKSIAVKVGGDTPRDLTLAAIASLVLVQGKEIVSKQEIIDEMKLAIGYFKPSYAKNIGRALDGLVKENAIIESSKDKFSLREATRLEIEEKLTQ